MFTGLIEQQGGVLANITTGIANRLIIKSSYNALQPGESIAVNGVCLTLLPESGANLAFDLSPETLALTTLAQLNEGDKVNLERAMAATARFGGHYVSGHVDTTACLKAQTALDDYIEILVGDFAIDAKLYLLPKGSITLEGVSLTINAVSNEGIRIMLVPHTVTQTTLSRMKIGQRLNVEFDYLTRIVAHQLKTAGQLKDEVDV